MLLQNSSPLHLSSYQEFTLKWWVILISIGQDEHSGCGHFCPHLSSVVTCPRLSSSVLNYTLLSSPVFICPLWSSVVLACPHLSSAVLTCPQLSPVLCCPHLSLVVTCPMLSSAVLSFHLPSAYLTCPLLSLSVFVCALLSSAVLWPGLCPLSQSQSSRSSPVSWRVTPSTLGCLKVLEVSASTSSEEVDPESFCRCTVSHLEDHQH